MPSSHYEALRHRLTHLAAQLPPDPPVPGSFTVAEVDRISAYAVMSSAACEHYLEERCGHVATHAVARFGSTGKLNRAAKHLCLMPFVQFPTDDRDSDALKALLGNDEMGIFIKRGLATTSNAEVKELLKRGSMRYARAIRDNHGIATKFHFKLLGTIGIDTSKFTPSFTSSIQSLWDLRGRAAHKVVVAATIVTPTSDMQTWTNDLIAGFRLLDDDFRALMKRVN
ncbi:MULTISPECIES: hypothetical protein [unclassified Sinorhizobium]|uniref:hypothetical protein n=1 Tax=unclassified Sinorhizobium TaxID=2613772 RepID=UPI0035254618